MKKYEVPVLYQGFSTYIVEARSQKEAERKAMKRFWGGETGDLPGYDEEDLIRVGEPKEID